MEKDKKSTKRSPNYTEEEKQNLLQLVSKYKGIIECKRTGAFYIQKKNEAWAVITKQYYSFCSIGPRSMDKLKHFYNNIKHRARKVSACENKQRYLADLTAKTNNLDSTLESMGDVDEIIFEEDKQTLIDSEVSVTTEPLYSVDENGSMTEEILIKDLKRKWTDEKKNIQKTGGGSYDPVMTDADHQVLHILDAQIRRDENPYDEAAEYFGENVEEKVAEQQPSQVPPIKLKKRNLLIRKKQQNVPKIEFKNKSAELLKKFYFKKKIELVYYQKKNEMQKFRHEQKKT